MSSGLMSNIRLGFIYILCHLQVGSADHHIHYYDLRNTSQPVHTFSGHKKAVSYVKFLSSHELASASTDSTLRLWDVKDNSPVSTFSKTIESFTRSSAATDPG